MSEVLEIVPKTTEELEKEAKDKAAEQGKEVVAKLDTQEGIAFLEENMKKDANDPSYDATAAALTLFGLYGPHLWNAVDRMSNNQMRRLLKCLVSYPLENIKPNKKNKFEYEAFKIADRLITSKYLVILAAAYEDEQKRSMAAEEHKKAEQAEQVSEAKAEELTKQE